MVLVQRDDGHGNATRDLLQRFEYGSSGVDYTGNTTPELRQRGDLRRKLEVLALENCECGLVFGSYFGVRASRPCVLGQRSPWCSRFVVLPCCATGPGYVDVKHCLRLRSCVVCLVECFCIMMWTYDVAPSQASSPAALRPSPCPSPRLRPCPYARRDSLRPSSSPCGFLVVLSSFRSAIHCSTDSPSCRRCTSCTSFRQVPSCRPRPARSCLRSGRTVRIAFELGENEPSYAATHLGYLRD
jgi:hypothetical protein